MRQSQSAIKKKKKVRQISTIKGKIFFKLLHHCKCRATPLIPITLQRYSSVYKNRRISSYGFSSSPHHCCASSRALRIAFSFWCPGFGFSFSCWEVSDAGQHFVFTTKAFLDGELGKRNNAYFKCHHITAELQKLAQLKFTTAQHRSPPGTLPALAQDAGSRVLELVCSLCP